LAGTLVLEVMTPALFWQRESNLPACCRTNGKHRCAMLAASLAFSGASLIASPTVCPVFPKSVSSNTMSRFAPAPAQVFYAAIEGHPTSPAQTLALRRIADSRSRQKRGPPHLL